MLGNFELERKQLHDMNQQLRGSMRVYARVKPLDENHSSCIKVQESLVN